MAGVSKRYDAIVVGGGHNGLVAAHYLGRAGLQVLVLERRHVVGGPCGPIEFFPGYRGAITNSPGSLEPKIVRDMELERFGLAFDRPNPAVVLPYPGGRIFAGWRERERVEQEFLKFSKHDGQAYYEAIEFFNDFARRLGVSLFEPPPTMAELLSRLRTPQDEADFAEIFFGSIKDFLDKRLESDEVKAILATLGVANGNVGPSTPGTPLALLQRPMSLASTSLAAEHDPRQQPLRGSTGLPRGGMGSVALAMQASLVASGVDVRVEAPVVHVRVGVDGAVAGVVLEDGEEIDAPLVLSNLNPKTTLLDLVDAEHVDGEIRGRLEQLQMRGAAFKLVLAVDDVPRFAGATKEHVRDFASCQFRVAPSMEYLDRCYDDYRYGKPSEGPTLWGLVPSVMDPTMAPEGHHIVSINAWYAPYHLREGDWSTEKHVFANRCIDTLAEHVPNLKDIIVDMTCLSPVDLEREFGLLEGHQLHGDMLPGSMFGARPVVGLSRYRTPVRGLYLCGSGAWPGGFVSGIPGHNGSHQALADLAAPVQARAELEAELSG